ncbi:hypothetical protein [Methylobacterium aquaticum]|uniref:hypothetical protein n=1 Tax=Methylobacterium aquaticum TaxID=270351 RepID=UPI001FED84E1|nr:hypothetical protein [Methylobacterium aquaticum]
MRRFMIVLLSISAAMCSPAWARLSVDDLASTWPRASATDKIDFATRMGKAMVSLSPELTRDYFMRCLEETANIGDTKALTLSDMVRTCVALQAGRDD